VKLLASFFFETTLFSPIQHQDQPKEYKGNNIGNEQFDELEKIL
jgi:hypothetical protein